MVDKENFIRYLISRWYFYVVFFVSVVINFNSLITALNDKGLFISEALGCITVAAFFPVYNYLYRRQIIKSFMQNHS